MINPELEKYIDMSLRNNMDLPNIRRILISAGWNAADVDEAITARQDPHQPAAAPGAAAVTPSMPSSVPVTTVSAAPTKARTKRSMPRNALVAAVALLLLLFAGGLGFAFYNGTLSLGGGLSDAELLARLPDNLQAIKSATYEGAFDLISEPREANAVPFIASDYYYAPPASPASTGQPGQDMIGAGDIEALQPLPPAASAMQFLDEWYPQLPADIAVRVTAGGSALNLSASSTDATFHAGAEVKLADFNVSADADFLKKDADLYFKINKFPSLFVDLSALKGKWVRLTPEDLGGSADIFGFFSGADIQNFVEEGREQNNKALEQARLIYRIAGEEGLILNKAPATSEKLDGENTRHFRLTLAKDKVSGFYARATKELKDKYGNEALWEFRQETADYLASPAFSKLFDYLAANTTFDLWLNSRTGQIIKYSYGLRLVPPPKVEKLKDVQYALRVSLALKNVNQPIQVTAPSEAMSFEDAEVLLSGKSREEVLAEKQLQNIMSIRQALTTYHDYANKYPESLDALLITYTDLYKLDPDTRDSFETSLKLLEKVPVDAYTKQPYNYRGNGADYVIEYTVNLPADASVYPLSDVANGVNHANSRTLSLEKKS